MSIPFKCNWLSKEPGPKMLIEAIKLIGTKETTGPKNNPDIMAWAKELGLEKIYTGDSVPWCGLAMGYVAKMAGKENPLKSYEILRALEWAKFGTRAEQAMLGDILVFKRDQGGHVSMYIAESTDSYYVLGGNQSDAFGFTWVAKSRLYAVRRPVYVNQPSNIRKILINRDGSLSQNEA